MSKINQALLKEYLELQYPIGKTELFLDNEDHSNYMGFTWQLDCKGRAIVGLDTNDTDFNAIGKTGGSKYLQSHTHTWGSNNGRKFVGALGFGRSAPASGDNFPSADDIIENTGDVSTNVQTGNSGNLQPYKVFAIWVRTA